MRTIIRTNQQKWNVISKEGCSWNLKEIARATENIVKFLKSSCEGCHCYKGFTALLRGKVCQSYFGRPWTEAIYFKV